MHIVIQINNVEVFAMLDTGATNSFIATRVKTKLGLTVTKSDGRLKTANTEAHPTEGATMTLLEFDSWRSRCKFSIVSLDDFDMVLGMEFLSEAKVSLVPHLFSTKVQDETTPCFV